MMVAISGSSQVHGVEYIEEEDIDGNFLGVGKLRVQFSSGDIYVYDKVERWMYDGLLAAPSKGEFFHRVVKKAAFSWHRESVGGYPR